MLNSYLSWEEVKFISKSEKSIQRHVIETHGEDIQEQQPH